MRSTLAMLACTTVLGVSPSQRSVTDPSVNWTPWATTPDARDAGDVVIALEQEAAHDRGAYFAARLR